MKEINLTPLKDIDVQYEKITETLAPPKSTERHTTLPKGGKRIERKNHI